MYTLKYIIWPFLLALKGLEIMYYDVIRPMTSQIHSIESLSKSYLSISVQKDGLPPILKVV